MTVSFRATEGGRADAVVAARYPGVGRRHIAALFARGGVRVDGRRARKGERVQPGAEITLVEAPERADERAPEPAPELALDIVYEDAELVAVSKPPGMPSHPLRARERGTLANALVARFPECAGAGADVREAGLVHRLDAGTTGVLVAARSRGAWDVLRAAFGAGRVDKRYLALVCSADIGDGGCDEPLARQGGHMVVSRRADALPAFTEWRVLARAGAHSLVECTARTGRMHQVRVHLAHMGAPIAGDIQYGGAPLPADMVGHFLHASSVALPHPRSGARLVIAAPLPADRRAYVAALAGASGGVPDIVA